MNITFERSVEVDAEALVAIQVAAFHHDAVIYPGVEVGGPPGYDSAEVMRRKIHEHLCYTIRADGQIVGGIVIYDMGPGHLHLDLIHIDPAYHNRGIGSRAMQFIEQAHPADLWTLDTPAYAVRNQHFYEKFGFVKQSEEEAFGIVLFAYEKRRGANP